MITISKSPLAHPSVRHEAARPLHPLLLVRPARLVIGRGQLQLAPPAQHCPAVAHVRHVEPRPQHQAGGGRATRLIQQYRWLGSQVSQFFGLGGGGG